MRPDRPARGVGGLVRLVAAVADDPVDRAVRAAPPGAGPGSRRRRRGGAQRTHADRLARRGLGKAAVAAAPGAAVLVASWRSCMTGIESEHRRLYLSAGQRCGPPCSTDGALRGQWRRCAASFLELGLPPSRAPLPARLHRGRAAGGLCGHRRHRAAAQLLLRGHRRASSPRSSRSPSALTARDAALRLPPDPAAAAADQGAGSGATATRLDRARLGGGDLAAARGRPRRDAAADRAS